MARGGTYKIEDGAMYRLDRASGEWELVEPAPEPIIEETPEEITEE